MKLVDGGGVSSLEENVLKIGSVFERKWNLVKGSLRSLLIILVIGFYKHISAGTEGMKSTKVQTLGELQMRGTAN